MKKIIYICALVTTSCLFMQSCIDDFLTQHPYSTSIAETFYETENHFKQALVGSYSIINASNANGQNVALGTYNYGLFYTLEGCSDVAVAATGTGSHFDLIRGSYQTSQDEVRQLWIAFYIGISRCNYLIEGIHNGRNELTEEQKVLFEGEARFLRAFYYTHLAQMFGGVPLYDAPAPGSYSPRNDLETVYAQIIADLDYAYKNLKNTGINTSSANKWTAGAYLGMVYNYLSSCKRFNVGSKYVNLCPLNSFRWVDENEMSDKARTILSEVISGSPYALVNKDEYKKLFYEMSKPIQYKECLFMSEFANNTKHPMSTYYVLCPAGDAKLYGGSYQRMFPSMNLYLSYSENDVRRDRFITAMINPNGKHNNTPTGVPYETVDNFKYYLPDPSSGAASGQSYALWSIGKFRVSDPKSKTTLISNQCVMNFPLMRMADVHLQYAEALYFCGQEPLARDQFKLVRERSVSEGKTIESLTNDYYRSDFVEELLEERARELCFEAKRKVDLIRFGKITENIQNLSTEGTTNLRLGVNTLKDNWREYKMWLPIPQLEIDLNQNLEQNPIYAD